MNFTCYGPNQTTNRRPNMSQWPVRASTGFNTVAFTCIIQCSFWRRCVTGAPCSETTRRSNFSTATRGHLRNKKIIQCDHKSCAKSTSHQSRPLQSLNPLMGVKNICKYQICAPSSSDLSSGLMTKRFSLNLTSPTVWFQNCSWDMKKAFSSYDNSIQIWPQYIICLSKGGWCCAPEWRTTSKHPLTISSTVYPDTQCVLLPQWANCWRIGLTRSWNLFCQDRLIEVDKFSCFDISISPDGLRHLT